LNHCKIDFKAKIIFYNHLILLKRNLSDFILSQERTKNAQFIIISLRNNMFELADRLIGIYKTDNCTKSVCINPQIISIAIDNDVIDPTTVDENCRRVLPVGDLIVAEIDR